jgi:hypothetical protein
MWFVVAAHVLLLTLFQFDRYEPGLIERAVPELWAAGRQWQFYLLIAVVGLAGAMSGLAWWLRGPVRLGLIVSWALFLGAMGCFHAERLTTMAALMWKHGEFGL